MGLYTGIARPLLFRLEAERAHRLALAAAAALAPLAGPLRHLVGVDDPRLALDVAGLHFPNPLGLAAGFDKSGTGIAVLSALGFGAIEIGSVSVDPSRGNPQPRLFRLPDDRAILVHYGLPNDGIPAIAARLQQTRLPVPLGINIVKTNRGRGTPPETAEQIIAEYTEGVRLMAPCADYLMLNLSCPNTEDGRDFFAEAGNLRTCLSALANLALPCPVFLKVSPLGGIATIERLLEAAEPHDFVSGFMFNLPPVKPEGLTTPPAVWRDRPGAVAGPPAAALAETCIRETYRRMNRQRYAIVGAGGIGSAADAYAKIRMGCSLVQMLTALVYEGPLVVRRILTGLALLLERDGFAHVADAVGADCG